MRGHMDSIQYLLDRGANIEAKNEVRDLPLYVLNF